MLFYQINLQRKSTDRLSCPRFYMTITEDVVTELMEAAWTNPSAGSFRSCSQLANSLPSLLLEHLLMCGDYQPPHPHCSFPSMLWPLINSLEAALPVAEGGSGAGGDCGLGVGSTWLGLKSSDDHPIQHCTQPQESVYLVQRSYSNVCLVHRTQVRFCLLWEFQFLLDAKCMGIGMTKWIKLTNTVAILLGVHLSMSMKRSFQTTDLGLTWKSRCQYIV